MRQSVDGGILPLIDSILLLIAIRYFAVGDVWKGLIASSKFIGFFLSAPLIGLLNRTRIRRSLVLSLLTAISALALGMGAIAPNGALFAIAASLCGAALHIRQPFFTELYGEFYSVERRAKSIALGLRLNLIIALCSGIGYGLILDVNLAWWRYINAAAGIVLLASSLFLASLPEKKRIPRGESWIAAIALPFRQPRFLLVQTSWMFVGFGNLWTLPLRAVYVAEPQRGLGLSPAVSVILLSVIPVAFQLLFNHFWAKCYQRLSFPVLRIFINFFFAVSIPLFFLTDSLPLIIIASALTGIGTSGAPFIWQLWVTRIAHLDEIRLYQSAHAFLAGVRGILAPFIGLIVLKNLTFQQMGFISGTLTVISCLFVLPLLHKDKIF